MRSLTPKERIAMYRSAFASWMREQRLKIQCGQKRPDPANYLLTSPTDKWLVGQIEKEVSNERTS